MNKHINYLIAPLLHSLFSQSPSCHLGTLWEGLPYFMVACNGVTKSLKHTFFFLRSKCVRQERLKRCTIIYVLSQPFYNPSKSPFDFYGCQHYLSAPEFTFLQGWVCAQCMAQGCRRAFLSVPVLPSAFISPCIPAPQRACLSKHLSPASAIDWCFFFFAARFLPWVEWFLTLLLLSQCQAGSVHLGLGDGAFSVFLPLISRQTNLFFLRLPIAAFSSLLPQYFL